MKPLNLKQSLLLHHYYQLIAVGNKKGEVKIYIPFNFQLPSAICPKAF